MRVTVPGSRGWVRGLGARLRAPRLSLRAYLALLAVVCVLPMVVFAAYLTLTIDHDHRAAIAGGGLALLLTGIVLAALAARPITRSFRTVALAAAELERGTAPKVADSLVSDLDVVAHELETAGRVLEEAERAQLLERAQAARHEAEAANRAKDEFLAILSHELRTPLNALRLWTSVLRSSAADESTRMRAVEIIERNTQLQARLIDDLLDISRITSGILRLNVQRQDVRAIVEAAVDRVRTAAENRGIRLAIRSLGPSAPVLGDPVRLQQAVWNVVANAVKFTPAGGQVDVELRQAGATLEISVRDNGRGIAADQLPYVFERFHRGPETDGKAHPHSGLGLGLTIARHLVELHGGTITAESAGGGTGSTFTISLPRAIPAEACEPDAAPGEAAALQQSPAALAGVDILLVDDDADTNAAMYLALGRYGARVRTATSAAEALKLIQEQRWPDVVVSDIGMPGEDGYSLIRRLRALETARRGHIPAIAVTAYASPVDRNKTLEAGFQAHMAKPVDPTRVVELVASLVPRRI